MDKHTELVIEVGSAFFCNMLVILGAIFGVHPLKSVLLPLTLCSLVADGYMVICVFRFFRYLVEMMNRSNIEEVVDDLVKEMD